LKNRRKNIYIKGGLYYNPFIPYFELKQKPFEPFIDPKLKRFKELLVMVLKFVAFFFLLLLLLMTHNNDDEMTRRRGPFPSLL
jgi:hypothetical protein